MTTQEQKRKSSSKFHKLLHSVFFFLDKIYKVLRVIDLVVKMFH